MWLGHLLGDVYFRKRDLEENLLHQVEQLSKSVTPLKRKLKYFKISILVSFLLFFVTLSALYVRIRLNCKQGSKRFSSNVLYVHSTLDHVFFCCRNHFYSLQCWSRLGAGLDHGNIMCLFGKSTRSP